MRQKSRGLIDEKDLKIVIKKINVGDSLFGEK